jgi:hypothetical protein
LPARFFKRSVGIPLKISTCCRSSKMEFEIIYKILCGPRYIIPSLFFSDIRWVSDEEGSFLRSKP